MNQTNGSVIWITGLSGAGKTTLARCVSKKLLSQGYPVVTLNGDELREVFGAAAANTTNHGREGRLMLAMRYAHLCRILAVQNLTVVIATISLFKEVHVWNRTNLPDYFEVYLKVPVKELRSRDSKGIYSKFDAGELSDVAGLDLPVDEPQAADWVVEYKPTQEVEKIADELLDRLMERRRSL